MGEDPNEIRNEIEQTREQMGDTIDAIGYKADVKSRARESISDKTSALKSKVTGAASSVGDATPDSGDVKQGAKQAVGIAQENPLGLALGGVAIGFVAGMLIPSTKVEDERIGPMADQVKEQVQSTAQEALDHGKQVAQEVASTAQESVQQVAQDVKETAQQSAQEHGEQVKQTAQENAEQAREQVRS